MKPSVVTRIQMKPEASGGRHAPFTEGYCPHFVVAGHSEWLGVRVVQCPGPVAPGDEAEVVFALMYHPQLDYSVLQVGTTFDVMEGPHAVATGRVLQIHHDTAA